MLRQEGRIEEVMPATTCMDQMSLYVFLMCLSIKEALDGYPDNGKSQEVPGIQLRWIRQALICFQNFL